jgi:mRNA interferase RelE/StbE
VSQYAVYVRPAAWREIKELPGHIRQRIKRAIDALADDPHPTDSKRLTVSEVVEHEILRLRLDKWRVVYLFTEADRAIDILAVRKRPPYDYGDLENLLTKAE